MPTTDPKKKQEQNWQNRYGISRRAYNRLHDYQNGMCAACGGPPGAEDGVFRIDHDHATGKVRGLLCLQCNAALGNVHDKPEVLARLKLYLEAHAPIPALPAVAGDSPLGPQQLITHAPGTDRVAEGKDPRIPTPEVIAALKGHGMTEAEIAQEFDLDRPTVRALYTEAQRSTRAENARDVLLQQALPHALATIIQAVQEGDAKTAMNLAKGLGVLRDKVEVKEEKKDGLGKPSFEAWRERVTTVTTERVSVALRSEQPALDASAEAACDAEWTTDSPSAEEGREPAGQTGLAPRLPGLAGGGLHAIAPENPPTSPGATGSLRTV